MTISEAFKQNPRTLDGYVELLHDYVNSTDKIISYPFSDHNVLGSDNQLVDSERVGYKYASFEEGYFKLDGSMLLPKRDTNNDKCGYVSHDISDKYSGSFSNLVLWVVYSDVDNPDIKVYSNGITFTFEEGYPTNFKVVIGTEDGTLVFDEENYDKEYYQVLFDKKTGITNIKLMIFNWSIPGRRARVRNIDLGVTRVFKNSDLISFDVIESVDPLGETMPINEINVTVSNYEDEFNPINPTGLTGFLKEGIELNAYIGAVSLTDGIKYQSMGKFYLKEWSSNPEKTASFKGQSKFYQFKTIDSTFRIGNTIYGILPNEYFSQLCEHFNISYSVEFDSYKMVEGIMDLFLKLGSLLEHFRLLMLASCVLIHIDRNGILRFRKINKETTDHIPLIYQNDFPKYTPNNKIKTAIIKVPHATVNEYLPKSYSMTFKSTGDITNVVINQEYEYPQYDGQYNIQINGGSINKINFISAYVVDIDVNSPNNDFTVTVSTDNVYQETSSSEYKKEKEIETGDTLTVDNSLVGRSYGTLADKVIDYIFENDFSDTIDVDYFGDPTLCAGDVVEVETRYGNKKMIILENKFTYDGGLKHIIKGGGIDV